MSTTINSYNGTGTTLGGYIDGILTPSQNQDVAGGGCPHHAFWTTLNYKDFTTGNVPGVGSYPILVIGNAANSNLVQALQGVGPLFNPNSGTFGQMPADGPPFFTAEQVQPIIDWINAGCPNPGGT
jgi:hypothetical protein